MIAECFADIVVAFDVAKTPVSHDDDVDALWEASFSVC
jgi:hypothetical protein